MHFYYLKLCIVSNLLKSRYSKLYPRPFLRLLNLHYTLQVISIQVGLYNLIKNKKLGFLPIVTWCVWDRETTYTWVNRYILEKVRTPLSIRKKKKKNTLLNILQRLLKVKRQDLRLHNLFQHKMFSYIKYF